MKMIEKFWFSGLTTVGIVIGEDERTKERKAYIGECSGGSEASDAKHILEYGAKVNPEQLENILAALKNKEG
jgi:hypothetical protein